MNPRVVVIPSGCASWRHEARGGIRGGPRAVGGFRGVVPRASTVRLRSAYLRRSFGCEAVTSPGLRQNQRSTALTFELGPQSPDIDPNVLGLGLIAVPPHPPQKVGVGQQLAPVGGELTQQREFRRRQVDRLP